jgi:hypothetical protein
VRLSGETLKKVKKSQDKSTIHKYDFSTDLPENQPGAIKLPNKPITRNSSTPPIAHVAKTPQVRSTE